MPSTSRVTWVIDPVFLVGVKCAIPCAACTAVIQHLHHTGTFGPDGLKHVLHHSSFSSFTVLISLFVAFRASHAYQRFWTGAQLLCSISSDLYDVASSLVDFSRHSKENAAEVSQFRQVTLRLFSVLHALILARLETGGSVTGNEQAFEFELIDLEGIDDSSREQLKQAGTRQLDLVFQWLRLLMVDGQHSGLLVAPAPILSRILKTLNDAIADSEKGLSLAEVPFPLSYTLATQFVLMLHWLLTPFMACAWSDYIWSAALLAFVHFYALVIECNCRGA